MTLPNLPYKGSQIPNPAFNYPEVPATFDRLFGARVANDQLDPNPSTSSGGWVRPADWLPLPEITSQEQKLVGLFAVYDLPGNFLAMYFEGDYTVDWGDGTVESFPSGETAQHSYNWSSVPSSTLTTQGYKQVIVTVTPQVGSNLTAMNLSAGHDLVPYGYSYPWLDIAVSLPEAEPGQSFVVSQGDFSESSFLLELQNLLILNTGNATDLTYAVYFCTSLRKAEIHNCSNVEKMDDLFEECYSLQSVAIYEATSCETMEYAFYYCYNLKDVVITGTSSLISTYFLFSHCYSLVTAPFLNTSSVLYMQSMFEWCSSLTTVPLYNTSSVESMQGMFDQCYCLVTIPPFNTSNVQDLRLGYLQNVRYLPTLNSSSVTTPVQVNMPSLQEFVLEGVSVDVSYNAYGVYGCTLGRQAILDIFNGLANASATIGVRNNYGAAELIPEDIAIATDKGWTVLH